MSSKNNVLEEEPTVRRIINDEQVSDNYEDENEDYEEDSDNNSIEEVPSSLYFDLVSYAKDLGIPIAEYLTANTIDNKPNIIRQFIIHIYM